MHVPIVHFSFTGIRIAIHMYTGHSFIIESAYIKIFRAGDTISSWREKMDSDLCSNKVSMTGAKTWMSAWVCFWIRLTFCFSCLCFYLILRTFLNYFLSNDNSWGLFKRRIACHQVWFDYAGHLSVYVLNIFASFFLFSLKQSFYWIK